MVSPPQCLSRPTPLPPPVLHDKGHRQTDRERQSETRQQLRAASFSSLALFWRTTSTVFDDGSAALEKKETERKGRNKQRTPVPQ